jgi:hypothetical protein
MKGGVFILILAVFLDFIQFTIGLAMTGVTSVVEFIPFIGQTTGLIGIILSGVIDFCLSVSFGALISALLFYSGLFYPGYLVSGWGLELLPGFNLLPGWTTVVIASILRKKSEEKGLFGDVAKIALTAGSVAKGKQITQTSSAITRKIHVA